MASVAGLPADGIALLGASHAAKGASPPAKPPATLATSTRRPGIEKSLAAATYHANVPVSLQEVDETALALTAVPRPSSAGGGARKAKEPPVVPFKFNDAVLEAPRGTLGKLLNVTSSGAIAGTDELWQYDAPEVLRATDAVSLPAKVQYRASLLPRPELGTSRAGDAADVLPVSPSRSAARDGGLLPGLPPRGADGAAAHGSTNQEGSAHASAKPAVAGASSAATPAPASAAAASPRHRAPTHVDEDAASVLNYRRRDLLAAQSQRVFTAATQSRSAATAAGVSGGYADEPSGEPMLPPDAAVLSGALLEWQRATRAVHQENALDAAGGRGGLGAEGWAEYSSKRFGGAAAHGVYAPPPHSDLSTPPASWLRATLGAATPGEAAAAAAAIQAKRALSKGKRGASAGRPVSSGRGGGASSRDAALPTGAAAVPTTMLARSVLLPALTASAAGAQAAAESAAATSTPLSRSHPAVTTAEVQRVMTAWKATKLRADAEVEERIRERRRPHTVSLVGNVDYRTRVAESLGMPRMEPTPASLLQGSIAPLAGGAGVLATSRGASARTLTPSSPSRVSTALQRMRSSREGGSRAPADDPLAAIGARADGRPHRVVPSKRLSEPVVVVVEEEEGGSGGGSSGGRGLVPPSSPLRALHGRGMGGSSSGAGGGGGDRRPLTAWWAGEGRSLLNTGSLDAEPLDAGGEGGGAAPPPALPTTVRLPTAPAAVPGSTLFEVVEAGSGPHVVPLPPAAPKPKAPAGDKKKGGGSGGSRPASAKKGAAKGDAPKPPAPPPGPVLPLTWRLPARPATTDFGMRTSLATHDRGDRSALVSTAVSLKAALDVYVEGDTLRMPPPRAAAAVGAPGGAAPEDGAGGGPAHAGLSPLRGGGGLSGGSSSSARPLTLDDVLPLPSETQLAEVTPGATTTGRGMLSSRAGVPTASLGSPRGAGSSSGGGGGGRPGSSPRPPSSGSPRPGGATPLPTSAAAALPAPAAPGAVVATHITDITGEVEPVADHIAVLSAVPVLQRRLAEVNALEADRVRRVLADRGLSVSAAAVDRVLVPVSISRAAPPPAPSAAFIAEAAAAAASRPATAASGKGGKRPASAGSAKSGGSAKGGKGGKGGKAPPPGPASFKVPEPAPGERPWTAGGAGSMFSVPANPVLQQARIQAIRDAVLNAAKKGAKGKGKGKGKKK